MIIDCFTFFNELDLLEVRLEELNDCVDYFVIVEASKTQSLIDKPFYFENNKSRYSKFLNKIIHVKINNCPNNDQNLWTMEHFQRDCILRGLDKINLSDNDWILISDLDEIPKCDVIQNMLVDSQQEIFSLEMMFSAYFANLVAAHRNWIGTVCTKYKILKQYTPQQIRNSKDMLPIATNAGWHLSWLGGYEKIYEKALSCIEPYDKIQIPSKESFKEKFDEFLHSDEKFFLHLENLNQKSIEFKKIQSNDILPQFMLNNIDRFNHFIL